MNIALIFALIVGLLALYVWGTWLLWRGGQRPVGLWFLWASLAMLGFVTWLTGLSIGIYLLPVVLVLAACAVGTTVATRRLATGT